ncbi:hypothetical protein H0H92_012616, partial [Tricholoma furcatifolium]
MQNEEARRVMWTNIILFRVSAILQAQTTENLKMVLTTEYHVPPIFPVDDPRSTQSTRLTGKFDYTCLLAPSSDAEAIVASDRKFSDLVFHHLKGALVAEMKDDEGGTLVASLREVNTTEANLMTAIIAEWVKNSFQDLNDIQDNFFTYGASEDSVAVGTDSGSAARRQGKKREGETLSDGPPPKRQEVGAGLTADVLQHPSPTVDVYLAPIPASMAANTDPQLVVKTYAVLFGFGTSNIGSHTAAFTSEDHTSLRISFDGACAPDDTIKFVQASATWQSSER